MSFFQNSETKAEDYMTAWITRRVDPSGCQPLEVHHSLDTVRESDSVSRGGNWLKAHPIDELIVDFLKANQGRYTVRQMMEGCGDDWNARQLRAAYYDALNPRRRRLVPGRVTRHEPDGEHSEITYSFKR